MSKSSRSNGRQQAGAQNQDAETDEPPAAIIVAAQEFEHYEIASYGMLCAWGDLMGHRDAVTFFQESLEEVVADEKPPAIAETVATEEAQTDLNDIPKVA